MIFSNVISVARIAMAVRSKETLLERDITLVLKKEVKTLDNKAYLSEDVDQVCDTYYELLAFLAKSTDRVNATTMQKAALKVFEADGESCKMFGQAMADAFSYLKGKARRFEDGEKQTVSCKVRALMDLLLKKALKK